ncbi:MAG: prenyltransferase/squalene oxidase repeat-containing protein [Planctomycetota bacterium]
MIRTIAGVVVCAVLAAPAVAISPERRAEAREMADRAIEFLRAQQDAETGGWAVNPEGPDLPAISALVLNGMLPHPRLDHNDAHIARGIAYVLSFRKADGGIHDGILSNYNTAISLSALSRVPTPETAELVAPGQDFLRSLQWSEESIDHPETGRVDESHPFYGGVGYGRRGRPDMSNLNLMLQGLHDTGVPADDPAFERAMVFLGRTQMLDSVNDMAYADGSQQGGFIYATGPTGEAIGVGQSYAEESMTEEIINGERVLRHTAYGSVTYAGLKSMVYADLDRSDERVTSAYEWIRKNYRLDENPRAGQQGRYYYYLMFARAMDAWGDPMIVPLDAGGNELPARNWADDLVEALSELQNEDGSFRSVHPRWMEDNPVLITAYALIALQHALGNA